MAQQKPRISPEERSRINSANGQKGKGKHSEEGKRKSSQNSRKHGLTGAGDVIHPEDQADLDAMLPRWVADLGPEGIAQAFFVRRMALMAVRLERSALQENAVLALKGREAIGAYDRKVQNDVEQLGKRLLDFPIHREHSPIPNHDRPDVLQWQRDEPIVLVMELKETVQGCDYLLKHWRELEHMLSHEGFWNVDSKLKAVRLLGKRYETILDDVQVGDIFTCCQPLQPELQGRWLDTCKHATWWSESRFVYPPRVDKLAERIPDDPMVALDFLHGIVDAEIAALEVLRDELMPLYELNRAEAPIRSALDDTKQGELRLRYDKANERELHRCLADFLKMKKAGIGGDAVHGDQKETEVNTPQEDTSFACSQSGALRNEAKWGPAVASEGASMALKLAPEGSERGESPPR